MSRKKTLSASLLCSAAMIALVGGVGTAKAQEARFDIAPQPLSTALNAFSVQSRHPIIFKSDLADAKFSKGVAGATDPQLALSELLAGTGLTWRRDGETFVIVRADGPQSGSAAGAGAEVEALIVTAQKREEDIQDVPIAISAFTQEDLTRSQIAGGPDLMTQVPNMTFTKTNFTSYSIQIRGIGTQAISATTDPAVAVAFNNTPFVRNHFFEQEFYDLARVEVLRGPQGTLYGRNATAGVVNVISAKPNLSRFEAKLSADVSNYNSTRLEGMVNLPISQDVAALRIAGAWTKREGFVTNEITGNPIDGRDLWSARATLRFEPTDWFQANLIYEHFEENDDRLRSGKQLCTTDTIREFNGYEIDPESGANGGGASIAALSMGCKEGSLYGPEAFGVPDGFSLPYYIPLTLLQPVAYPDAIGDRNPYRNTTQSTDLRVIESTVDPSYRADADLAELQISIHIGERLTLNSETAYATDFIFSTQDFNRFNTASGVFRDEVAPPTYPGDPNIGVQNVLQNGVFCDPQIGCADRLVAVDLATAKSRQFSQEFRLASDYEGPFNFSLGANFLRYDTEDKYYVFINSLSLLAAVAHTAAGGPNVPMMPLYEPGVTTNAECLPKGMVTSDPTAWQELVGCIYMDPNPINKLNDLGHNYFLSKNPYKLISYAAFGEAYYNITSELKLTAGLRFTVDKKEAPRIPSWLLVANSVGYPVLEVVEQEWREPTGRLTLDWKPDLAWTDDTLLYASYAHGYKAGGSNPPPAIVATLTPYPGLQESIAQPKTFDAEFVDAYEVGSKNTVLDGKLTLNASAFFYDYKNYQVSQIINRSATNYNFDATVWGLEMETDWRPVENLRLGVKLGYEHTRIADGEQAIDIMDRTAGHDDWVMLRAFPTMPSNCVVPRWLLTPDTGGAFRIPSWLGSVGTSPGPCVNAYISHIDPVTLLPYIENPTVNGPAGELNQWINYPGFNPASAPNNGEGFFKDISGHELPNAPHNTATLTADYTLPLPSDWLMTLHTDLYYQAEAWNRVFNTEGYDKLKAYTNVNLAAIFINEDAGWNVMAYVKNVFDKDNITGAFLNSDDTGHTTNVFLNEPRLYGLRVTKQWTGSPWWETGGAHPAGQPYPLTVELGGQLQRHDAPYSPIEPAVFDTFPDNLDPLAAQGRDLDWGDGRELRLTYRPSGAWFASVAVRHGETNSVDMSSLRDSLPTFCIYRGLPQEAFLCREEVYNNPGIRDPRVTPSMYANGTVYNHEEHEIVEFSVGKDVALGGLDGSLNAGLRHVALDSDTAFDSQSIPAWMFDPVRPVFNAEHHRYLTGIQASRAFEGTGPEITWEAGLPLFQADQSRLDLTWTVSGGVLFGRQKSRIQGQVIDQDFIDATYFGVGPRSLPTVTTTPISFDRSQSVTVPTAALSAGFAWTADRMTLGAGYRWERYFDAIDGGYAEQREEDRTIDGPYLKISIGFGG